ncbi:uncharacterized protein LOC129755815 isoform X1 [Uranotaenia lowii]|uniref:uncharacterized protein LOC129755815 isoform X1 n=1 Tax=Uranotaenia lowii TaxID=190385 RepID=UPI00247A7E28|nr:uncharacterized protein LOC129755815 isoform X1 [Uranotaenia lowii]
MMQSRAECGSTARTELFGSLSEFNKNRNQTTSEAQYRLPLRNVENVPNSSNALRNAPYVRIVRNVQQAEIVPLLSMIRNTSNVPNVLRVKGVANVSEVLNTPFLRYGMPNALNAPSTPNVQNAQDVSNVTSLGNETIASNTANVQPVMIANVEGQFSTTRIQQESRFLPLGAEFSETIEASKSRNKARRNGNLSRWRKMMEEKCAQAINNAEAQPPNNSEAKAFSYREFPMDFGSPVEQQINNVVPVASTQPVVHQLGSNTTQQKNPQVPVIRAAISTVVVPSDNALTPKPGMSCREYYEGLYGGQHGKAQIWSGSTKESYEYLPGSDVINAAVNGVPNTMMNVCFVSRDGGKTYALEDRNKWPPGTFGPPYDQPTPDPNAPVYKPHIINWKSLYCPTCKKWFLRVGELAEHNETVHGLPKPFHCSRCDLRFGTFLDMSEHVLEHLVDPNSFWCSNCPQRFLSSEDREKHWIKKHRKPSIFCRYCGKGTRPSELGAHHHAHEVLMRWMGVEEPRKYMDSATEDEESDGFEG